MFLNSFNYFRAIAITLIVMGHCNIFFIGYPENIFIKIFYNLTMGGTSLFVFISGFLFHHIFSQNYNYKKFLLKKIKKVFVPYSIMSIIPIIYYAFIRGRHMKNNEYFLSNGDGLYAEYFLPALKYYTSGEQMVAYWYIPFIMVVFFMSPFHIYFSKLKLKSQLLIISPLFLVSVFMHRPNFSAGIYLFQSVLYFTPIYLIGIICSQQKNFIYEKFHRKEYIFLFVSIFLAILQFYMGTTGNYHKMPFILNGFDLMIIQKLSLCLFFMVWLHRFEHIKSKALDTLASISFGIFFIHGFVLFSMRKIQTTYFDFLPNNFWLSFALLFTITMALSIVISLTMKKIFDRKSVYIIGC